MLRLVLEKLQPRPAQFEQEEERMSWAQEYSTVAPVILRMLNEMSVAIGMLQPLLHFYDKDKSD